MDLNTQNFSIEDLQKIAQIFSSSGGNNGFWGKLGGANKAGEAGGMSGAKAGWLRVAQEVGNATTEILGQPMGENGRFKRGIYDAADPLYYLADQKHTNAVGEGFSDAGVSTFKKSAQQGDVWGMLAGGIMKGTGSLINAAFGGVDKEQLEKAKKGTEYLRNYNSTASNFGELQNIASVGNVGNPYSGGWFRKGWERRHNNKLINARTYATEHAYGALENNINNIAGEQTKGALRNWYAFGGPFDYTGYPISGAIDYDFAQRRLAQKDMEIENEKALGGPLHSHGTDWSNGITFVDNGGSHESNPFEGVPMGMAPDGQPNLVEEGEVIFNDYVFSNRLKVPEAIRNKYKLRGTKGMTFADAAKKAQKESEERPNDPISQRGLEDIMNKLMMEQETVREKKQQRKFANGGTIHIAPSKKGTFTAAASKHNMGVQEFASKVLANPEDYSPAMRKKANFARNASKWKHAYGGYLTDNNLFARGGQVKPLPILGSPDYEYGKYVFKFGENPETQDQYPEINMDLVTPEQLEYVEKPKKKWFDETWLRYAPAVGSAIGLAHSIFNKPDYRNSKRIETAANDLMKDIAYNPIGNYLTYRPFDRLFYANQLGAQAAATRRALINNSGANRASAAAGLLASDYNAQLAAGNLFRQAEEYNLAQREKVEDFNRGTNIVNATNDLKAKIASGEIRGKKLSAIIDAAKMREAVDAARMAAISSNLTNFFDNLGDIGIDAYNRKDRDMLIRAGIYGTLSQKPQEWSEERWRDYQRALSGTGYKKGNGGKIKRRGITI